MTLSSMLEHPKKYSVVDLFAGAGGLSYGFLQTNRFEIKAAFENNANAQKTYKRNHSSTKVYDDVEQALNIDLGNIDVVIGGPPCQGFSSANRQKNHIISQNNSLVKKFVQIVLHLKPTAFVMENVSMLKSNIHRFYVDEDDITIIKKYNIKTSLITIPLLDEKFLFERVENIISDNQLINYYLWDEKDYFALNSVLKMRKSNKLKNTLIRHKTRLLSLAKKMIEKQDETDPILSEDSNVGVIIQQYFYSEHIDSAAEFLCEKIESAIMRQRMFSKAKEIFDHNIKSEYSIEYNGKERGLVAKVTSMAVIDYIEAILGASSNKYKITKGVLSAATFGAPQKRMRFVLMGIKKDDVNSITLPVGNISEENFYTVEDAIKDIEDIETAVDISLGNEGIEIPITKKNISELGRQLRDSNILYNHISTASTQEAVKRFKAIKQGKNFHSLDVNLKTTYSDPERTQNTIYLRLAYNQPSGTVVNVRKSMWIHPIHDRALSIREAARLQTFPDSFVFCGTKDAQYQQVGNAVPPVLAKAIAEHLCRYLDGDDKGEGCPQQQCLELEQLVEV
ncbi:DNA cytosine methyltransferase [Acinetobacter pittii]|uniref:DNA cytosine methyltransferase n=1 Tax=Acinetobacter pittii TaxID=48296 RepID=UPI0019807201|nr:DNA cytosine methyltransferase [Acinetobacter pittii]